MAEGLGLLHEAPHSSLAWPLNKALHVAGPLRCVAEGAERRLAGGLALLQCPPSQKALAPPSPSPMPWCAGQPKLQCRGDFGFTLALGQHQSLQTISQRATCPTGLSHLPPPETCTCLRSTRDRPAPEEGWTRGQEASPAHPGSCPPLSLSLPLPALLGPGVRGPPGLCKGPPAPPAELRRVHTAFLLHHRAPQPTTLSPETPPPISQPLFKELLLPDGGRWWPGPKAGLSWVRDSRLCEKRLEPRIPPAPWAPGAPPSASCGQDACPSQLPGGWTLTETLCGSLSRPWNGRSPGGQNVQTLSWRPHLGL